MEQILFALFVLFLVIISFGVLLQKYLKLPWMFTIVITGLVFSNLGIFEFLKSNVVFQSWSQIGMYFLLFLIGLKINIDEMKEMIKQIFVKNIISCLFEGISLSIFFYFALGDYFHNSYVVCLLIGIGFATIGEVILIAILHEFKLTDTKFGQLTLGMGVSDDIVEIIVLTFVSTLPTFYYFDDLNVDFSSINPRMEWLFLIASFLIVFAILLIGHKLESITKKFLPKIAKSSVPFVVGFLYLALFLGLLLLSGILIQEFMVIGAISAGILCNFVFPEKIAEQLEKKFQFLMFFIAPFFFFSVGYKINFAAMSEINFVVVLIIIVISIAARVLSSIVLFKKQLGDLKNAVVFGFGLCAKFSTSVIIISLLVDYGYITVGVYSLLMVSFLLMKIIVVFIYSKGVHSIFLSKMEKPITPEIELKS